MIENAAFFFPFYVDLNKLRDVKFDNKIIFYTDALVGWPYT